MIFRGLKYLTVFEAQEMTGRKASTWRRDIFERKIASVKIGRQVRIPLSEINKLIEAGWRDPIKK
jgi:excisionase family DNA binding protein